MSWYGCHVVMSVRFKDGPRSHFIGFSLVKRASA